MKQHIKGVLIALIVAVASVFLLSLLMPSQIVLEQKVFVRAKPEKCYLELKNKQGYQEWLEGLRNQKLDLSKKNEILINSKDGNLYRMKASWFPKRNSVEWLYFKEEDKQAVLMLTVNGNQEGSWIKFQQIWDLGWNPIAKLIALRSREETERNMSNELIQLKSIIETNQKKIKEL